MSHGTINASHPLQSYANALLFSPSKSLVRSLFQHGEPKWLTISPSLSHNWSACLQTLEIHSDDVMCIAFSHNSALVACGSSAGIEIWDACSGACLQILTTSLYVECIAFSCDSKWLATTSNDKFVRIWDVDSGLCLKMLEGHREPVTSVAFSHSELASATFSDVVQIWDPRTGACLRTLETGKLGFLAFSHDRLALGRYEAFIQIWDSAIGTCLMTLEGEELDENYLSAAFSPALPWLASGSADGHAKVWQIDSGVCLRKLEGHFDAINSVSFSHDSAWVVSASDDKSIKIWDINSGSCLHTLIGHGDIVHSVDMAPDSSSLVSGSHDGTVKIWDTGSDGEGMPEKQDYGGLVQVMAFSRDALLLATCSDDGDIKVWDSNGGAYLQTLEGFEESFDATTLTFSYDSKQLVAGTSSGIMYLWNISSICKASYPRVLMTEADGVISVALNLDSTQIVICEEGRVQIWDVNNAACSKALIVHGKYIWAAALSHDSKQLAWATRHSITIWDLSSDVCLRTFDTINWVKELWFDPTGSCLHTMHGVVGEPEQEQSINVSKSKKWITHTGKKVLMIPKEYQPWCHCWSRCGTRLAIATWSRIVWIFSVTGQPPKPKPRNLIM